MPNCWNVICKTPIDIESDGSPPLYCSLCGVSVPLVMFSSITKTSKSCRSCGKLCRPRGDGQTPIFCSRCGCDELSTAFGDIFDTKPRINNNHLEKDIANPPSTPGAIFGEEAHQDDHDLLADNLSRGLLGAGGDCGMSDVWLSMEQAFENDISNMLPNTDHLSEPGLIVSDLIDSDGLHDLPHTIKSEPVELDTGPVSELELEIKIEVDDKLDFLQTPNPNKRLNPYPLQHNLHHHHQQMKVKAIAPATARVTASPAVSRVLSTTTIIRDADAEKKPFSCQNCGGKYATLPDLKCHKMLCYGSNASDSSRPYKCDQCGCSYTRKYHLDTHKDRYHSNTSYSCGKCFKIYRAREDYLRHLRKNSCTAPRSKTVSKTSEELIMNSQRLNNVHRFQCRHCPKRFFRRHYLERHIEEKHHGEWKELENCSICSPGSSRNQSNASSPGTADITPELSYAESDFSSDDSGLMAEEMGGSACKRMKRSVSASITHAVDHATTINVIGPGDDLIGNGLYIKPDSSLYQCVMCDYTTKYISQLSQHLDKHQASTPGAASAASRKQANLILTV